MQWMGALMSLYQMVKVYEYVMLNTISLLYQYVKATYSCDFWESNSQFYTSETAVLEMKIWIYWSESNYWIYFYIVLNKNWQNY